MLNIIRTLTHGIHNCHHRLTRIQKVFQLRRATNELFESWPKICYPSRSVWVCVSFPLCPLCLNGTVESFIHVSVVFALIMSCLRPVWRRWLGAALTSLSRTSLFYFSLFPFLSLFFSFSSPSLYPSPLPAATKASSFSRIRLIALRRAAGGRH